jgi:hypothetical protein
MSEARSAFRARLDAALHAAFVDGVQWPLEEASLAALVDLGLSDAQIASYFAIDPADVRDCKQKLGLKEH